MVDHLRDQYRASERHACQVLLMVRGTYRYQSHQEPWTELRMRIREIAQSRVRYGYRKIRVLLNREGWNVGKYLVYRSVQGRRSGLEETAKTQEESGAASGRALHRDGTEPGGLEHRLRCRSASGWNALPRVNHAGRLHARSGCDRSSAELEGETMWCGR